MQLTGIFYDYFNDLSDKNVRRIVIFHALAAFVLRMRIIGDINILLYPLMQK